MIGAHDPRDTALEDPDHSSLRVPAGASPLYTRDDAIPLDGRAQPPRGHVDVLRSGLLRDHESVSGSDHIHAADHQREHAWRPVAALPLTIYRTFPLELPEPLPEFTVSLGGHTHSPRELSRVQRTLGRSAEASEYLLARWYARFSGHFSYDA
jgi:hypothetical protein